MGGKWCTCRLTSPGTTKQLLKRAKFGVSRHRRDSLCRSSTSSPDHVILVLLWSHTRSVQSEDLPATWETFFLCAESYRERATPHSTASDTDKMKRNASTALSNAFQGLRISSSARPAARVAPSTAISIPNHVRLLSTTPARMGTWLEPSIDRTKKMMKGRPRVATGGSTKGTTVIWGDYGLRMDDHHRRISAKHLKMAEDTIKTRLRGEKYRLYKRVCCNIGVYTSGNEVGGSQTAREDFRTRADGAALDSYG